VLSRENRFIGSRVMTTPLKTVVGAWNQ